MSTPKPMCRRQYPRLTAPRSEEAEFARQSEEAEFRPATRGALSSERPWCTTLSVRAVAPVVMLQLHARTLSCSHLAPSFTRTPSSAPVIAAQISSGREFGSDTRTCPVILHPTCVHQCGRRCAHPKSDMSVD